MPRNEKTRQYEVGIGDTLSTVISELGIEPISYHRDIFTIISPSDKPGLTRVQHLQSGDIVEVPTIDLVRSGCLNTDISIVELHTIEFTRGAILSVFKPLTPENNEAIATDTPSEDSSQL